MELYRFTGALTGLLISGGISLFFFICGSSSNVANGETFLYMLVPAMVFIGSFFDVKIIWRTMSRVSRRFRPSYVGSAVFWTFAWPICWLLADIFARCGIYLRGGSFIAPPYLSSFGLDGIIGFFLMQAMVGSGMGLMFFMAYRPIFDFITTLRIKIGMGDPEYELTLEEELGEFGFRK